MTDLNEQFMTWMLEKQYIEKDKRPYGHTHQTVRPQPPTGKYLGPGGSYGLKKGGPGSGRKPYYEGDEPIDLREARKQAKKAKKPYFEPVKNTRREIRELKKGLRGPQKGAKYQKLGAKFSEEVEPRLERNLPKDVQWAVAAHTRHKTPETARALSEAFRRHEFREDPYSGIKGFKRQPLAFGKLEKHQTPKFHRHVKLHPGIPGASISGRPLKRETKDGVVSRFQRYLHEHGPTSVSSGHGRRRTALYDV